MTENWTIRAARADDHAGIVAIWERSVRATHDFLTVSDIDFYRPLLTQALGIAELEVWILAGAADVPVGFMLLADNRIEGLFLDPDIRRNGGGRLLVAHAQALHEGELRLDVNEQNAQARGFYERLGFVVEGRSELDGTGRPYPLLHMVRRC